MILKSPCTSYPIKSLLGTQNYSYHRFGDQFINTMHLLSFFTLLAAILHTVSALPHLTRPFLDLASLPNCARSCTQLLKVSSDCLASAEATIDYADYIGCFCGNEWLRSLNNIGGICDSSCAFKDETEVQRYYGGLCGVPSPYVTTSSSVTLPTSTPTASPTMHTPATTSDLFEVATTASPPSTETTHTSQEQSES